jgi:uncharacterized protein
MLRFIFLLILFYLLYRLIRVLFYPSRKSRVDISTSKEGPIEDEMVKDPYCETYILKKDSHSARISGQPLYFCSKECLEKYKKERA